MLVLSRYQNQSIVIDGHIEIMIVEVRGDKVRLGISAPANISVHRKEVQEAIDREGARLPATKRYAVFFDSPFSRDPNSDIRVLEFVTATCEFEAVMLHPGVKEWAEDRVFPHFHLLLSAVYADRFTLEVREIV